MERFNSCADSSGWESVLFTASRILLKISLVFVSIRRGASPCSRPSGEKDVEAHCRIEDV